MPHRQLVGTFHPCGTVAHCTGRDAYDVSKSLIWPRGMALSSAISASSSSLAKPYHSHPVLPASSLHKIQEISKPGRNGAPSISDSSSPGAGAAGDSIPALGSGASTRALRRARSDDVARLLHLVEKKAEERSLLSRMNCQRLTSAPAPALGHPATQASTLTLDERRPQFASADQTCSWPESTSSNAPLAREPPRSTGSRMKRQGLTHTGNASSRKKGADPVKKIAVRVSTTLSMRTTHKAAAASAMDDAVLLMVPKEASGSRVIALALAAREFDSEDDVDVVPENPDHFDLLRLRPIAPSSKDKFYIGAGVDRTKPIGDAGTLFFLLCKSRE